MSEDERDLSKVPGETAADVGKGIAKASVSWLPFIGGPIAEVIDLVLKPAIAHRREEWFRELGSAVQELSERLRDFDPAALAENEMFVTAVLSATTAALRTHQREKLRALRNAVVNSALGVEPDEHVQLMFIRFVDELTALHLQLLTYLADPPAWFERNGLQRPQLMMGSRTDILEAALPELRGKRDIYLQAVRELGTRGLAQESITGMVSEQGLWDGLASPLGRRFLRFIQRDGV